MSKDKAKRSIFRIKGKTTGETLENLSFILIVISAVMISLGIGLGSFYKYVILLASFGTFLLLIGIIIFVISELLFDSTKSE